MELLVENFELLGDVVLNPLSPMTDEQFLDLCQHYPDCRLESSAEGEVIIMPPTHPHTGKRNAEINFQLSLWGRSREGDTFDSSTGFFLPNGARRSADAARASPERTEGLKEYGQLWYIVPNFVIELKSSSDRLSALRAKMYEWVGNGVDLAWLIIPEKRTVEIYRAGTPDVTVLRDVREVRGEGAVEGFVLELDRVWAGVKV